MKKIFSLSLALCALFPLAANAQKEESNSMIINLKTGESVEYVLSDIQNIVFRPTGQAPQGDNITIAIPTNFSTGWVQKVMVDGKQVAEVCREYINAIKAQRDVVYLCGEDGRADLSKGLTTLGETVEWNLETNVATVTGTKGETAASSVYINNGELSLTAGTESKDASVQPDVISDRRGTELNTYLIVKIGTQYWMAENLRATKYADGSAITAFSESQADEWKANTTGAYLTDAEADWVKIAGYLYNGYCVTNEKGIAPAGWAVPTRDDLVKLRTAGGILATNFKDSAPGTWSTGTEGINLNGFMAVATGYYSTATNLTAMFSDAYFWSSTLYTDWLKKTALETFRINGAAKNVVVSNEAGHDLLFGHSIRCIRK